MPDHIFLLARSAGYVSLQHCRLTRTERLWIIYAALKMSRPADIAVSQKVQQTLNIVLEAADESDILDRKLRTLHFSFNPLIMRCRHVEECSVDHGIGTHGWWLCKRRQHGVVQQWIVHIRRWSGRLQSEVIRRGSRRTQF